MALRDFFGDDLTQMLGVDDFGQLAQYHLNGLGAGFPLYVVIGDGQPSDQITGGHARESVRVPIIAVRSVIVAGADRDALRGDTVVISTDLWTVETVQQDDGGAATLWCSRSVRKASTMPGLRG
jgi:uncharacterized protein YegL